MAGPSRPRRVVTFIAIVALAAGLVWLALTLFTRSAPSAMCVATGAHGSSSLDPDQADNAALIAAVAISRGMPERAVTVGLATALQESKLRNLTYGHADSLGLFQQRPSMGWGTPEEILDPVYSTNTFFDALERVDGWELLPVTEAAQAVQRSAFPDAYAQHETRAAAFAAALVGAAPQGLVCRFAVDDADLATLQARVARDRSGLVTVTATDPTHAVLTSAGDVGPATIAAWAVAAAQSTGLGSVVVEDHEWRPTWSRWHETDQPAPPGQVLATLGRP